MSLKVELMVTTRCENVLRKLVTRSKEVISNETNIANMINVEEAIIELNEEVERLEQKTRVLEAKFGSLTDEDKDAELDKFNRKLDSVNETIEGAEDELLKLSRQMKMWKIIQQQEADKSRRTQIPVTPNQTQVPPETQQNQMNMANFMFNQWQIPMQKLPVFKGDKWQFDNYWALFTELVDKPIQNKMIKFNQLLNSLEGDPRELMNRFKISEENYEPAKQLLIDKYTNKRETVQHLHGLLKDLNEKNHRIEAQRKLYEKVLAIILQLKSRDQDTNNWLIQDVIIKKFSHNIQRSVHRAKGNSDLANNRLDSGEMENTEDILKRINNAISLEESIGSKMKDSEEISHTNAANVRSQGRETQSRVFQQSNSRTTSKHCPYCQLNNHNWQECRKFKTQSDRSDAAKEKRLCFNCLGPHQKKFCQNRSRCFNCKGFHHTSLCSQQENQDSTKNGSYIVQQQFASGQPRQFARSAPQFSYTGNQFNGQQNGYNGRQFNSQQRNTSFGTRNGNYNGNQSNRPFTRSNPQNGSSGNQFQRQENQNVRRTNLATIEENQEVQDESETSIQSFQGTINAINVPSRSSKGYLPIVSCKAFNEKTKDWNSINILLDTGADNTHIRSSLFKELSLPTMGQRRIRLQTFGNEEPVPMVKDTTTITLLANKEVLNINGMVMDQLTGDIPKAQLTEEDLKYIEENNIILNSKETSPWISPDIVIGTDVICKIWKGQMEKLPSGIHLINTIFGYTAMGQPDHLKSEDFSNTYSIVAANSVISEAKENAANEIEWIDSTKQSEFTGSEKEEKERINAEVMKFYEETVEKREGLGYVVRFPWKENKDQLPDHYIIALKRLQSVVKSSPPAVLQQMETIFDDQKKKNIIMEIPKENQDGNLIHYSPHHPVLTPHKATTKCRVVMDGDCRFKNGLSLNDVIHAGPVLLKDLFQILIRFRSGKFAILSDIEKAFLFVYLHEMDQDATRFLWLKDITKPATEDNIIIYRFTRVLFGINASPFLLNATIKLHLEKEEDQELATAILNQIYVDNILMVTDKDITELYSKLKDIFNRAGMNLREFRSNDEDFNMNVPVQDLMEETETKVLGVLWNTKRDTMKVCCNAKKEEKLSRRKCSSIINSNFDPYGIMAPLFFNLKNFYSTLWRENQEWDTPLLQAEVEEWNTFIEQIDGFSKEIQRELISLSRNNTLITFTDASKHATASVVYNKVDGNTNIVAAKSKVTNKFQNWTIPKLELKALSEGTRLTDEVLKASEIGGSKFKSIFLLTDSEICKKWIERPPGKKDTGVYVTNRLREMRSIWKTWIEKGIQVFIGYVNTAVNPADAATRGLSKDELENHIWWKGPEYIANEAEEWPDTTKLFEIVEDEKLCANMAMLMNEPADTENPLNVQTNSLPKMKRIYAYVLKFVRKLSKGLNENRQQEMTNRIPELKLISTDDEKIHPIELNAFENLIIKHHQRTITQKTIKQAKEINPYMDEFGIIRCRGRMDNIEGTEDEKFPILVNQKSSLSRMIIDEAHGKYHNAVGQTIATVREKFWIPALRQEVKKRIQMCVRCQRFNSQPFRYPNMMGIPKKRVIRARPFQNCGLDYFGPLKIKKRGDDNQSKKGEEPTNRELCYGAIITCATTRLIYLDLVRDLSTESFILMMRRFFATHGIPSSIVSDNAPQFLLAKKIFKDATTNSSIQDGISNFCMSQGIEWKTITAYSPWKGGFYERLIRSVKLSLNKAYGRRVLSFDELKTSLQEIAGTLNCRPLTYSEEKDTISPIRPIDFISPKITISIPALDKLENPDEYLPNSDELKLQTRKLTIDALQSSLKFTEQVWKIWKEEYIRELRTKQKSRMDSRRGTTGRPTKGSVVLLVDENIPRNSWRLGRITSAFADRDGEIREVKLVTDTRREISRPINLLVPLEIDEEDKEMLPKTEEHRSITVRPPTEEEIPTERRYNLRRRKQLNYDEDIISNVNISIDTLNQRDRRIVSSNANGLFPINWLYYLTILMCFVTTAAVERNSIECVNSGIRIHNYTKGDMKICAESYCTQQNTEAHWMSSPEFLEVWIPAAIKSQQHHVSVKAKSENLIFITEKTCQATSFCDSISCTWCSENIFNPKCFPGMFILIMTSMICSILGCCYVVCCFRIRIGAPFIMIYNCLRWCCQRRRISKLRRRRSEVREALLALTVVIAILSTNADGCQDVEVQQENNRVCIQSVNGEESCSFEMKEVIKLNSYSREGCIRISQNGTLKAELKMNLLKAQLKCQRETIVFTRDVKQNVISTKRCPHMGSCSEIKCENVTRESKIEEFEDLNGWPGVTGCVESCGGWGCNCFFPSSACLFYRIYAEPISNTTFEIFRCDVWKETVRIELEMKNFEKNTHQRILEKLTANQPRTIENVTIQLTGLHMPPSPLLNSWFIQGRNQTAVWERNSMPQLQCKTKDQAEEMNCKLEEECHCQSAETRMMCSCKEVNITQHLESLDHKFPLSTTLWTFQGTDTVFAEIEDEVSATFLLSFQKATELSILKEEDDCEAENAKIEGCYKCQRGAVANIKCRSKKREMIAELECQGEVHSVMCSPNSRTTPIHMFERMALINRKCTIRCGSTTSTLQIHGVLEFHGSFISAITKLIHGDAPEFNNIEFPDFHYLFENFKQLVEEYMIMIVVVVSIIGLMFFAVFFKMYTMPIRMVASICRTMRRRRRRRDSAIPLVARRYDRKHELEDGRFVNARKED